MEILTKEKSFRYLSGVIKYLQEIKASTAESDIKSFSVKYEGRRYRVVIDYRW